MTSNSRIAGRIALWTAVATLGLGAVAGVAIATTSAPTKSTAALASGTAPAKGDAKGQGHHRGRLAAARRVLHGEFVVKGKDGKYETLASQRGSVTAVSATSITLRSADGFTATYAVDGSTRIRKEGKKADIGAVKVADPAFVLAVRIGTDKTARGVIVKAPRAGKD